MEKLIDYISENGFCSLEELKESKLDLNAPDKRGYTPLMLYCEEGRTEEALFLMNQKGALINAQDKFGYTPLMKAVLNDNIDLVTALLTLNADVEPRNTYGFTALSSAIFHKNRDIAVLLIASGASLQDALSEKKNLVKMAEDIGITMNNTGQTVLIFPNPSKKEDLKKSWKRMSAEHERA